ncbi:mannan-binding lectin serine protease 1-like isoform X3 [Acropora palmata]|uniref:mannan-binding lectin serine protease 1-like isoform X3 n=1 Tax=Acropora palmata TaxID=6131 RepID=UPI003DA0FFCD
MWKVFSFHNSCCSFQVFAANPALNRRPVFVHSSVPLRRAERVLPSDFALFGPVVEKQFAMPLKITLILAICAFLVNIANSDSLDCGQVQGDNLKSPGWPNLYPHNIDNCHYSVAIPSGKDMVVYFHFFDLESHSSCRYDRLDISDSVGNLQRFCGNRTGTTHLAKGRYVNLNLKTDGSVTKRGYDLYFIPVDPLPLEARRKRTLLEKKLNIKNYDEAQGRQIEDVVRTFVKTRGLKRAESESLEDKKPEVI